MEVFTPLDELPLNAWRYPAVAAVAEIVRGAFGGRRVRNALAGADCVLKLRAAATMEAVNAIRDKIASEKDKYCDAGLEVLRNEVRAARERVKGSELSEMG